MFTIGTYSCASVFTCIYASIALSRKGINKQQRSLILRRNIVYQIIVIICNSAYYICQCIVYIFVAYSYDSFNSNIFSEDPQKQELKFVHFLYQFKSGAVKDTFNNIIWTSWILFFSRDIILFIWMCFCPIFRYTMLNYPMRNQLI